MSGNSLAERSAEPESGRARSDLVPSVGRLIPREAATPLHGEMGAHLPGLLRRADVRAH